MKRLNRLHIALGMFVALLLQAAVFPVLFPRWVVPDLVFCFSAVMSIIEGTGPGVVLAAIGGLCQDALSGTFMGASAGANMAAAWIIGLVEPQLFKENLITPVVIVGAGTVIREVIYTFVIWSFGAGIDWARAFGTVIPWVAVLNCCAGALLHYWIYLRPRDRERLRSVSSV
ncbi:MAG TPA: rod shape-determining protein MreD [Bacillota bacterium]|nr:rod shape-determining protein MreD [Bacillota bacterium]HOK70728.1 rod shape-determining protein MreD [Bacillota bacterium]HOL52681.1 rod shape-determining protein MreD [Bacillota bacterium]HPZ12993.1 rod shape-determining protein MreD [Bacillota bacterium]HQD79524.1 rod shape-determining protein MreD [Bacillota bacterium]